MAEPLALTEAEDLAAVARLMNRAYREAPPGWNSESHLLGGQRADPETLAAERASRPGTAILVAHREGALVAAVQVAPIGGQRWYLGGLTVEPAMQGRGMGDRLLRAAEQAIAARGGRIVELSVIIHRAQLIAWYERRGYSPTGETRPFPYGDARFGLPRRDDLAFALLEKRLAPPAGD